MNYFSNSIFNRKKYEGGHWDDVIHKYKETELVGYLNKVIFTYSFTHSLTHSLTLSLTHSLTLLLTYLLTYLLTHLEDPGGYL